MSVDSYAHQIGDCAKRSPELIQLLELHSQFAAITPYTQVSIHQYEDVVAAAAAAASVAL